MWSKPGRQAGRQAGGAVWETVREAEGRREGGKSGPRRDPGRAGHRGDRQERNRAAGGRTARLLLCSGWLAGYCMFVGGQLALTKASASQPTSQ